MRCACEVSPTCHPVTRSHVRFLSLTISAGCDRTLTLWHFDSAITGSASVEYALGVTNLSLGSHIISSTLRGKLPLKAAVVKNKTRQLDQNYDHITMHIAAVGSAAPSAFTLNSHPTLLIRPFETGHEITLNTKTNYHIGGTPLPPRSLNAF